MIEDADCAVVVAHWRHASCVYFGRREGDIYHPRFKGEHCATPDISAAKENVPSS